jgi:hypothetical protein
MAKPNIFLPLDSPIRRLLLIGLLIGLLGLVLPGMALAGPPEPGYEGPEKCAECHSVEAEAWQQSPHARALTDIDQSLHSACSEETESAECTCLTCHTTDFRPAEHTYAYAGVSCEACHGPYVEDHPKNGVMQLDVDSSVCHDCHQETYQDWKESSHGEVGVQCIGCHLSHSQDFRLTDEELCGACHRDHLEDFAHNAHSAEDITCADCHMSSGPTPSGDDSVALASAGYSVGRSPAPSHVFTVAPESCVNCHKQTIHEEDLAALNQAENVHMLNMADRAVELDTELKVAKETNKSLQGAVFIALGLGLGIGGWIGICFMLVLGYITQGRAKK